MSKKNPYKAFELYQISATHYDEVPNNSISLSWLLRRAKEGNSHAEYFLGVFFFDPNSKYMDDARAFYWLTQSANKNYARAVWALAHCWDRCVGTYRDCFTAFMMMRKAEVLLMLEENRPIKKIFSDKFAPANENQTWRKMLEKGLYGTNPKFYKNLRSYEDGARLGDAYLAGYLARIYLEGIYLKRDLKKAVEFLEMATQGGHKTAPYALGICYLLGDGVEKDDKKAFENFALADTNGYPTIDYARCYIEGWGTEKNDAKALEILTRVFNGDETLAKKVLDGYKDGGVLKNLPVSPFDDIEGERYDGTKRYYEIDEDEYRYF